MYFNSILCVLCLVLWAGMVFTEKTSGHNGRAGSTQRGKPSYLHLNTMSLEKNEQQHTNVKPGGIINIDDEAAQNDEVDGSGGRDDTETGSGLGPDDEDGELSSGSGSGSGSNPSDVGTAVFSRDNGRMGKGEVDPLAFDPVINRPLTKCEIQRAKFKEYTRELIGTFYPVCKNNGDFKEEQCSTAQSECWCVDRHGAEVKYTRKRMPTKPNCERDLMPEDFGFDTSNVPDTTTMSPDEGVGNGGYQAPRDTVGRKNKKNKNKKRKKNRKNKDKENQDKSSVEPETEPTEKTKPEPEKNKDAEKETYKEEGKEKKPDETNMSVDNNGQTAASTAFMASPGILAGIIGGTIVGLLCAILLVLFIVYRMRKKDEGSYALDEPKHSPSMHSYQRAPAREFYA